MNAFRALNLPLQHLQRSRFALRSPLCYRHRWTMRTRQNSRRGGTPETGLNPPRLRSAVTLRAANNLKANCTSRRTIRPKILIANPRLGFPATPTKQTSGPFSNRERLAIFSLLAPCQPHSSPIALVFSSNFEPLTSNLHFLTGTRRLEFALNHIISAISNFLIGTKRRVSKAPWRTALPHRVSSSVDHAAAPLSCLRLPTVIISNSIWITASSNDVI